MCDLLQEVCSCTVPKGAHLHPYWLKALQMPLRRMHQGFQTSWKALNAQEVPLEQNLYCSKDQEET